MFVRNVVGKEKVVLKYMEICIIYIHTHVCLYVCIYV